MSKELQQELIAVIRKHTRSATASSGGPEQEAAAIISAVLESMRDVVADALRLSALVEASPRVQAALTADPSSGFAGNLQAGDVQDAVAVWNSFGAWLASPVDVGGARTVAPGGLIQRREQVYSGEEKVTG